MVGTESGTLVDRPLGSLLRDLADQRFTGIVHIEGSLRRIICLSEGQLYLAMSSPGVSLQHVVIDAGATDEEGWHAALEQAAAHGSVIAALLAAGAEREALGDALRELTLGTLLELLVPDHDRFRIAEGETHRLGAELAEPVGDLLHEAGRRLERWGALEDVPPSMTTVLRRAPELPPGRGSIDLDRVQWRIIDALDEPLTLTALIENTGVEAFRLFDEVARLLDERVVVPDADADPVDGRRG